ncbi:MAG: hypothetical protein JOY59_10530 [Candidatus Eremiobacteraeota bacterium]|nr:hypothetical protein [Candidatus Eremiobacteraeota bacterium]
MHPRTKVFIAVISAFAFAGGVLSVPKPAKADDVSSLLLGAAAGIAATAIYENVLHKQQASSQIVGYTANGCAVYADGHTGCTNTTSGAPISCVGQTCAGGTGYGRYSGVQHPYSQTAYGQSAYGGRRGMDRERLPR